MKIQNEYAAWARSCTDLWLLGFESWSVMAMRTMRIAGGRQGSSAEVERMFSEKLSAAAELQAKLWWGGMWMTPLATTQSSIRHYRRKVGANRRRLTRQVDPVRAVD